MAARIGTTRYQKIEAERAGDFLLEHPSMGKHFAINPGGYKDDDVFAHIASSESKHAHMLIEFEHPELTPNQQLEVVGPKVGLPYVTATLLGH